MRFWKMILFVAIAVISITACRKPSTQERYYDAHKKMMEIRSYETTAKILSYTEDNKRVYEFNQSFKYPNKYRLEVMSPNSIQGNLTIFNGKIAWIQHNTIGQTWKMNNFDQSKEQLMFIGYFLKNFISSENSIYQTETLNGQDCIVIITELPGGNPHFYSQKLWIDGKDYTPLKLNILDNKNRIKFEVYYENFKTNVDLEDSLFYLEDTL